jgi:hypothetical protein
MRYLEYGSAKLQLPKFMVGMDKKGQAHLYPSLTPKGHLSVHGGVDAIGLETKTRGAHIKAVKGTLANYTEKVKKVAKKTAKAKTAIAEVASAQAELAVAAHQVKTRGRKKLTEEEKQRRAELRKQEKKAKKEAEKQAKKAEKEAEKQAKKAEKQAQKAAAPKKTRTRKPKQSQPQVDLLSF